MKLNQLFKFGAVMGAFAAFGALSAGCSAAAEVESQEEEVDSVEGAASLSSTSTYFEVRRDFRRCAFPMCSGYWVKRVNKATTVCVDGKAADECYVATVDFERLGLGDAEIRPNFLLRGEIKSKTYPSGKFGNFVPTEAWNAHAATLEEPPAGSFYRLGDNGIRCVRAPCFSINSDRINSTSSTKLSGLTGAFDAEASAALGTQKIIAVGTYIPAPQGGKELIVNQFYTRVTPKPADPLACTTDAECTRTAFGKAVTKASECYCPICPTNTLSASTAAANEALWNQFCSRQTMRCPMVKCMAPPPVACIQHRCEAAIVN
jgi:hypothetical protein